MAGGEGSSQSKSAKRKAEAIKGVAIAEEKSPNDAEEVQGLADPINDWPTSGLKEKYIKNLETDGFIAAQEISRWRCAYDHEFPTEETEEIAVWKAFFEVGLVIGKGGRNLKEMKQKFGARVEYLPGENKFRINGGTLKAVDDARAMILEIINKGSRSRTSQGLQHGKFTSQHMNGPSKESVSQKPQPSYTKPPGSSQRIGQSLCPPPGYGYGPQIHQHQGWFYHAGHLPPLYCPPRHGIQLPPEFGPPGYGVQAPPLQGPPDVQDPPLQGSPGAQAMPFRGWSGHGLQTPPLRGQPGSEPPPRYGWHGSLPG